MSEDELLSALKASESFDKRCKCSKKLVDKLVEECSKNIDGNKILHNETLNVIPLDVIPLNDYKKVFGTLYIVLFVIFLVISTCISSVFIYFHWYLKKDNVRIKFNPGTQTTIY